MAKPINKNRVEQCARIYASNTDAGKALGIAGHSFGRACKRYGVESPAERNTRLKKDQDDRAKAYAGEAAKRLDNVSYKERS